jgi:hypothetical protein
VDLVAHLVLQAQAVQQDLQAQVERPEPQDPLVQVVHQVHLDQQVQQDLQEQDLILLIMPVKAE